MDKIIRLFNRIIFRLCKNRRMNERECLNLINSNEKVYTLPEVILNYSEKVQIEAITKTLSFETHLLPSSTLLASSYTRRLVLKKTHPLTIEKLPKSILCDLEAIKLCASSKIPNLPPETLNRYKYEAILYCNPRLQAKLAEIIQPVSKTLALVIISNCHYSVVKDLPLSILIQSEETALAAIHQAGSLHVSDLPHIIFTVYNRIFDIALDLCDEQYKSILIKNK